MSDNFADILQRRIARRSLLKSLAVGAVSLTALRHITTGTALASGTVDAEAPFNEIPHEYTETARVPEGYEIQTVIRWGDALFADAPAFNPQQQTAAAQLRQFGYNCDFAAFLPLPQGSQNSKHGLLCVNHEYVIPHLMQPNVTKDQKDYTKEQVDTQLAAVGHSVVEITQSADGQWHPVVGSHYNRRLSLLETECILTGPAAGHARLQTRADTTGTKVIGTFANCSGGVTPWGTVITAEENIDMAFRGTPKDEEEQNHTRMGLGTPKTPWVQHHDRFDIDKDPHEPNRFGWLVEYDPYNPESTPKKRTALGRFKHEAASIIINGDGRVVVYSGDDQAFEHLYKFVSKQRYQAGKPNADILDDGTLYAAQFQDDGTLLWLPLVFGKAPLNAENGFHSQADVLIEARRAASLMGATPMDRPEDVEVNPVNRKLYVNLTNNIKRVSRNIANPRTPNIHGHIVEITPPRSIHGVDHAQKEAQWDMFILAGNPTANDDALYPNGVSEHGWFSCPDNMTFDNKGNIWIATDGMPDAVKFADGLYMAATEGAQKARPYHFFNAPKGAEVCGPYFTPDNSTLFISVQHPGDDEGSSFSSPNTRWPDFDPAMPPRPSVIAITKKGGGRISL